MNFVATMIPFGIFYIAVACLGIYLTVLVIKALRKYLKSEPVRKEKQEAARNLGEVLKQHRVDCKMTQEFVAESLGVSRQAVSVGVRRFRSEHDKPDGVGKALRCKRGGLTQGSAINIVKHTKSAHMAKTICAFFFAYY